MSSPHPSQPHPSKLHLQRLFNELVVSHPTSTSTISLTKARHVILLQGAHTLNRNDTDRELPFRQESNFLYLTGCTVPSSFLVAYVDSHNTSSADNDDIDPQSPVHIKLFVPPPDLAVSMWSGTQPSSGEIAIKSGLSEDEVDNVSGPEGCQKYIDQLVRISNNQGHDGANVVVHTLPYPLETTDETLFPYSTTITARIRSSVPSTSSESETSLYNSKYLLRALQIVRLIKSPVEIGHIREANRITSAAHEVVMRELGRFAARRAAAGHGIGEGNKAAGGRNDAAPLTEWEIESEADAEAVFIAACRRAGAESQAYLPIVASGSRASTLHYVCNDRIFPPSFTQQGQEAKTSSFHDHAPLPPYSTAPTRGCCPGGASEPYNDLQYHTSTFLPQVLLIDAGCEVAGGYASDVTRTFPVGNGGKFTKEGKEIYELVLKMQKAVEAECKAGVHWDYLHLLCHRILAEEFLKMGVFKNASIEEILESSLTWAFLPHGLGHSMGIDVHDSLQLLRSEHLDIPAESAKYPKLFQYLRIRRVIEENMVLTIEPGCYFSEDLMNAAGVRQSSLVDVQVLERYIPVGGVRLEDDVVVKKDGCENLTTVGREVDWVEGVCSGAA